MYRTFAFTFELSVTDYADDSMIASETGRNKAAVLYLAERRRARSRPGRGDPDGARCGVFDDDLEVYRGWVWTRTAPTRRHRQVLAANPLRRLERPEAADRRYSGSRAFVTGGGAGSSANANDLDGRTSVRSPRSAVIGTGPAAALPVRVRARRELVRPPIDLASIETRTATAPRSSV